MRISLILALTLLASELLPSVVTRTDRRDSDLGISSTFAMALVITGPIGLAVGLRSALALVSGLRGGLPARRIALEVVRWSSAMLAARAFYGVTTHRAFLGTDPNMAASDIPWALGAAAVLFAVHHGVGIRRSLDDVRRQLGHQLVFELSTSGLLLAFAPVVVTTVGITAWLLPLLLLPIATIQKSAALAA